MAGIFASIIYTVSPMLYGEAADKSAVTPFKTTSGNGVILLLLVLIVIMGFNTPQALAELISLAEQTILPY